MSGSATLPQTDEVQASWSATSLGAFLCFFGACLLYTINIDRFPHPDELYHILAARGLLESGEPRIAEGVYERVFAHTWLIARLFDAFGESLFVARIPSIVSMSATIALLFIWLSRYAGTQAASIGSVLFAVSPFAVDIAQFVRFYGLQTVTFFSGAACVYVAVESKRASRWIWAALALPFLGAALYFQKTTAIGILGLLIWGSLRLAVPWLRSTEIGLGRKVAWLSALLVLGVLALVGAWQIGLIQDAWHTYRTVPLFNRANANQFWFYHAWYNLLYPSIWPALGLIGLAALASRPSLAFFAATIFVASFLLNSFAAPKSLRYLIYAQPFAFALLGVGLSTLIRPILMWLSDLIDRFSQTVPTGPIAARRISYGLVGLSMMILVLGNPAFVRTGTLLAGITIPPEKPAVNWLAAEAELEPHLEAADVVLTQAELEMLYYFDRYDILLSASRLSEIPEGREFSPDFRTGRPVIASVAALDTVFRCFERGIFVTNTRRWGASNIISKPLMEAIERNTTPLDLPATSRVLARVWSSSEGEVSKDDCPNLPHLDSTERANQ